MNNKFSEFLGGVRSVAPLLIGTFPFGLIYGAAAVSYHLNPVAAQSMSMIVFAGSAQFIMIQMIGSGVPAIIIIMTAAIVNVRHVLYSAALTAEIRYIRPKFWRWLLSYLLVDEVFAAIIARFQPNQNPRDRQWYFLGAGCALWCIWQISTAIGIFVGAKIPASWNLDFTLQLTFIAILTLCIGESHSRFLVQPADLRTEFGSKCNLLSQNSGIGAHGGKVRAVLGAIHPRPQALVAQELPHTNPLFEGGILGGAAIKFVFVGEHDAVPSYVVD